jgi:hypothetical protein
MTDTSAARVHAGASSGVIVLGVAGSGWLGRGAARAVAGQEITPRQASIQASVVTGAPGPPLCDREQYPPFREE